jgi:hypothetical protein
MRLEAQRNRHANRNDYPDGKNHKGDGGFWEFLGFVERDVNRVSIIIFGRVIIRVADSILASVVRVDVPGFLVGRVCHLWRETCFLTGINISSISDGLEKADETATWRLHLRATM